MPERKTIKTSVSLKAATMPAALKRAADLGFDNSFSGYIAKLIKADLVSAGLISCADALPTLTPTEAKVTRGILAAQRRDRLAKRKASQGKK